MRIVHAVHQLPPDGTGGTELYTERTARHFAARGHDVSLVTCADHLAGAGPAVRGTDDALSGLPVHRLRFDVLASDDPVAADTLNPHVEAYLRAHFRRLRPDLVHVCHAGRLSAAVLTAARALGVPVVFTATDFWAICPTSQLRRHDGALCSGPDEPAHCLKCLVAGRASAGALRPLVAPLPVGLVRAGLRLAAWPPARALGPARRAHSVAQRAAVLRAAFAEVATIVALNRFTADLLARHGLPRERMVVLPHGLDVAELGDPPPHRPADRMRFGYLGALAPHKAPHLVVEAFGRMTDEARARAQLHLYGDDAAHPAYGRRVRSAVAAAPGVWYHGSFTRPDLPGVLAGLDVLVVPSVWYENTPFVIYEAAWAGVPVVAGDVGGMAELVADLDAGWTFPVGDAGALATTLGELASAPDRVAAARARIRPVPTMAAHFEGLASIYRRAAGAPEDA
jgi:glycosyltransferase involved in cell wall biosynthesis